MRGPSSISLSLADNLASLNRGITRPSVVSTTDSQPRTTHYVVDVLAAMKDLENGYAVSRFVLVGCGGFRRRDGAHNGRCARSAGRGVCGDSLARRTRRMGWERWRGGVYLSYWFMGRETRFLTLIARVGFASDMGM